VPSVVVVFTATTRLDVTVSAAPVEPPPLPALSETSVSWRALTFGDAGTPYKLASIAGWDELPAFDTDTVPLPGWYGTKVAPIRFAPRTVTLAGFTFDRVARDALQITLRAGTAPLQDSLVTEPLTISEAGMTLSADARIVRVSNDKEGWSLGRFGWAAQWLCSDPVRYGPSQTSTAVIALPVDGIVYPITYPVTYPANPPSGSVTVNNQGTASAAAVYRLVGPLTQPGIANVDTGKRVEYNLTLAVGDELVIDTAQQAAFLNGEYRTQTATSDLTSDLEIPAGKSTLQALGDVGAGGAPLISVTFRPAYW
jgi:hypothetical protein